MPTATSTRPSTSGLQGEVLAEAARRMLPVIGSRLLAAVADRAEASIDALSDRLDDLAENGGSRREQSTDQPAEKPAGDGGLLGTVVTMALQQARAFLDLVVRLLAQAAAAARTAAERLRSRRAPEGIDDEAADDTVIEGEFEEEDEDEQVPAAV